MFSACKRSSGCFGQAERRQYRPVICKAYKCFVKSCVPQGREQDAVVYIEPLGIVTAVGPWDDVGGPKQSGIGDAGEGTAVAPIVQQRAAEYILADALHDETFGLRATWEAVYLLLEVGQRDSVRQAGVKCGVG